MYNEAVEGDDDENQDSPEEGTEEDKDQGSSEEGTEEDNNENENPATGDENMISAYAVMLVISMSVLGAVVINRKRVINK